MARMRGSIVEREKGKKYLIRAFIGKDPRTGKRMYTSRTIEGNKTTAKEALTALLRELDMGTFVQPTKESFGAYLLRWIAYRTTSYPKLTRATLAAYERRVNDDVLPYLGHMALQDVTTAILDQHFAELGQPPRRLSPGMLRYTRSIIRSALEQAVTWGLIKSNPATKAARGLEKGAREESARSGPSRSRRPGIFSPGRSSIGRTTTRSGSPCSRRGCAPGRRSRSPGRT